MPPAPSIANPYSYFPSAPAPFPHGQIFLWIPDKAGVEIPFCSCNEVPGSGVGRREELIHDGERYLYALPDPSDRGGFSEVPPPLPLHPIPINRFLTLGELQELAREVRQATGESLKKLKHPLDVLRIENKCYIVVFFARMGLLSSPPVGDRI